MFRDCKKGIERDKDREKGRGRGQSQKSGFARELKSVDEKRVCFLTQENFGSFTNTCAHRKPRLLTSRTPWDQKLAARDHCRATRKHKGPISRPPTLFFKFLTFHTILNDLDTTS